MRNKKTIIIAILAALLSFPILYAEEDPLKNEQPGEIEQQSGYNFRGRIIYIDDNLIEVKKGKTELLFYFQDDTVCVSADGETGGKEILENCQNVRVIYTVKNADNILLKVIVLKESNCYK